MYLFAYGSLMRRAESDGLGFACPIVAELTGWRTAWNVASDPAEKSRAYFQTDGRRYAGLIASLGIERSETGSVFGVIGSVPDSAITDWDRRERDYRRIEVTPAVIWRTKRRPPGARVWTYAPLDSTVDRYARARQQGNVAVVKEYYQWVLEAAVALGDEHVQSFLGSGGLTGVPIADMVRVDG